MLVNNAASFFAGFFEELTPEQIERQLATSLIGPMNVTRAVLPVMREQRSGPHRDDLLVCRAWPASSTAPPTPRRSSASKAGWNRSPRRSSRSASTRRSSTRASSARSCSRASTDYATPSIEDYGERNAAQREFWEGQNGQQAGDPAKLAQALLRIATEERPPRRFIAGADAIATAEQRVAALQSQIDAYRELSNSLGLDRIPSNA